MLRPLSLFALFALFALNLRPSDATSTHPPTPFLLKDINQRSADAFPDHLIALNDVAYFAASTDAHGRELWRSDGTAAGTRLVKDIWSGISGGIPSDMTVYAGALYFAAEDSTLGRELWRSDGSAAGTTLFADLHPGSMSSAPTNLIVYDGLLYFNARHPSLGYELWRSDGTAAGTYLLHDVAPGADAGFPFMPLLFNDRLYFVANIDDSYRLHSTDGSADGLRDENLVVASPPTMTVLSDTLIVATWEGNGRELRRFNADGSHELLTDINPNGDAQPAELTVVGDQLFFVADDGNGLELWVTDGTTTGTRMVSDIGGSQFASMPYYLTAFGDRVAFVAADSALSGGFGRNAELWISDGTAGGTYKPLEINPDGPASPSQLFAHGSTLYFTAYDGDQLHVYASDGTTAGTRPLNDDGRTVFSPASSFVALSDKLLFALATEESGNELFTVENDVLQLVSDINGTTGNGHPEELVALDETVVFVADGEKYNELWGSDGTSHGTQRLLENTAPGDAVLGLARHGERVFFGRFLNDGTAALWATDGTAAGTVEVVAQPQWDSVYDFVSAESRLFFTVNSRELWKTDGTAAGSFLVEVWEDNVQWMTAAGDDVFMSARATTSGRELWFSDGTTVGTYMVKDINPGVADSSPSYLTMIDGTLFFSANNGTNGTELWVSDGTADGTQLVKDINTTTRSADAFPQFIMAYNGLVYFSADDGVHGRELWVTDGTADGTHLFADAHATDSAHPTWATEFNGDLYLVLTTADGRQEIWRTDGDPNNLTRVTEINANGAAHPQHLTVVGDWLYFAATDAAADTELYRTDGTTTQQVGVINPNGSASPTWLTEINGRLIFQARRADVGTELFGLILAELTETAYIPLVVR